MEKLFTPEHEEVFRELVCHRTKAGFTSNHSEFFSFDIDQMKWNIKRYKEREIGRELVSKMGISEC